MNRLTVHPVRCVEGCGGGNDSLLVIIGLVVAGLSLCFAYAAWRVSKKSLGIAQDEHRVFMDRFNARADFDLTLDIPDRITHENVLEVTNPPGTLIRLKWRLGLENSGEKAADGALVNFLLPTYATDPKWVTRVGHDIPDTGMKNGPELTPEELVAADDSHHPVHYLIKEVERVPLKGARVAYAAAAVLTPAPGEEVRVPASFRVESDDLPDDVEDRRIDLETIVRNVR